VAADQLGTDFTEAVKPQREWLDPSDALAEVELVDEAIGLATTRMAVNGGDSGGTLSFDGHLVTQIRQAAVRVKSLEWFLPKTEQVRILADSITASQLLPSGGMKQFPCPGIDAVLEFRNAIAYQYQKAVLRNGWSSLVYYQSEANEFLRRNLELATQDQPSQVQAVAVSTERFRNRIDAVAAASPLLTDAAELFEETTQFQLLWKRSRSSELDPQELARSVDSLVHRYGADLPRVFAAVGFSNQVPPHLDADVDMELQRRSKQLERYCFHVTKLVENEFLQPGNAARWSKVDAEYAAADVISSFVVRLERAPWEHDLVFWNETARQQVSYWAKTEAVRRRKRIEVVGAPPDSHEMYASHPPQDQDGICDLRLDQLQQLTLFFNRTHRFPNVRRSGERPYGYLLLGITLAAVGLSQWSDGKTGDVVRFLQTETDLTSQATIDEQAKAIGVVLFSATLGSHNKGHANEVERTAMSSTLRRLSTAVRTLVVKGAI
jgi:hypothetical protein